MSKYFQRMDSNKTQEFYSTWKHEVTFPSSRSQITPPYPTLNHVTNTKSCDQPASSNINTGLMVAIVVILTLVFMFAVNSMHETSSQPRELTIQEKEALQAVKSQRTIIASDMVHSVAVVLALYEADGHRASIDGWYVSSDSDHISVYIYFYLDGKREYAEWWYYYPSRKIIAKNTWAFTFQGE
ncbi:MAG: hypothetical protein AB1894_29900 [Chloroflexota bacterium]